jgi:hypothetical protein
MVQTKLQIVAVFNLKSRARRALKHIPQTPETPQAGFRPKASKNAKKIFRGKNICLGDFLNISLRRYGGGDDGLVNDFRPQKYSPREFPNIQLRATDGVRDFRTTCQTRVLSGIK